MVFLLLKQPSLFYTPFFIFTSSKSTQAFGYFIIQIGLVLGFPGHRFRIAFSEVNLILYHLFNHFPNFVTPVFLFYFPLILVGL